MLNGIYWRLQTGSPWEDIPERYGPSTTCYNRFVRWRKKGVWDRLFAAVSAAYEGDAQQRSRIPRRLADEMQQRLNIAQLLEHMGVIDGRAARGGLDMAPT